MAMAMAMATVSVMATTPQPDSEEDSARPSVAGMGLTAAILLIAGFWAVLAAQSSYFSWLRSTDWAAAYAMRPDDPIALREDLWRKAGSTTGYQPGEGDVANAKSSLVKAPLGTPSLWIIGAAHAAAGDLAAADAAMYAADKVTRRDTLTQLWLIERSVAKDDVEAAIRHYDAALSVEIKLEAALFPILSQAISFPEVRKAMVPYLERKARWAQPFVGHAAENAEINDFLALVSPLGKVLQSEDFARANRKMAERIASEKAGFEAIDYAGKAFPGFDREAFARAGFSSSSADRRLGSLAWRFFNGKGILTSFGQEGAMEVRLQPASSGNIAMRDVPVKPGATYRFSQTLVGEGDVAATTIRWYVRCASAKNSRALGRFDVPWSAGSSGFAVDVAIPPDCGLVNLRLGAVGPNAQLPANFTISQLEFHKK